MKYLLSYRIFNELFYILTKQPESEKNKECWIISSPLIFSVCKTTENNDNDLWQICWPITSKMF